MTTASAELGVVFARSAEGHTMQPVSFEEVQCPVTKTREWRSMVQTTLIAAAPCGHPQLQRPTRLPRARLPLGPERRAPAPLGCQNEAAAVL